MGVISERKGNCREFFPYSFYKDSQGQRVAYSTGPFIYGIHSGRSHDYSVWRRQDIRRSRLLVRTANGMPGLSLQLRRVYESHRRRRRQEANIPSFAPGRVDKARNVSSRRGSAGYDIQDFTHAATPERSARDWSAVGTLPRDRSIRFDIRLRATGRQFTSRGASRSASRSFPRDSSRFPH
jgi:hypothetical protein